jgi:hypothetical protein
VRQEKVEGSALTTAGTAGKAELTTKNNNYYNTDDKGAKGGPSLSREIRHFGFPN